MRIVGGKYRGRTIAPPRNLRARPTTDFAKENLFNVLSNLVDWEETNALDLFSGTGSISYELVSRGARSVTAVEINPVHASFIRRAAEGLGADNITVVKANAFLYLKSCSRQFGLIFSDAPYDLPDAADVIGLVEEHGLLLPGGLLVFEHSAGRDYSRHPWFVQLRHYGSVHFSIFRRPEQADEPAAG